MDMNFEIAYPWLFFLLPLPLLVYALLPPLKKRKTALKGAFFFRSAEAMGVKPQDSAWISKRNMVQWFGLAVSWVGILIAASNPKLVGQPDMKVKTSRSFLVVADISFSMDTRDWAGTDGKMYTRWEGVKQVLGDFIEKRKGDRLGLVFFGSNAYLQAPLTTDTEIINWLLSQAEVSMAGQMTAIGKAIGFSHELLQADSLEHKVMLLLTDGADSGGGISPLDVATAAAKDSVTIYTLGIGDPNAPSADLDEATLKAIAEQTGGQYFLAMDEQQLAQVYETLNELEPMEYEQEEYRPEQLLFIYPLAFSLISALVLTMIVTLFKFIRR